MTLEHFMVLIPLLVAGLTYLNRIRSSVDTARTELQAQIASTREELRKDLHEITAEVRKTNGRLGRLEEWRSSHDHVDDQREIRASKEIDTVREDIRQLQVRILSPGARA